MLDSIFVSWQNWITKHCSRTQRTTIWKWSNLKSKSKCNKNSFSTGSFQQFGQQSVRQYFIESQPHTHTHTYCKSQVDQQRNVPSTGQHCGFVRVCVHRNMIYSLLGQQRTLKYASKHKARRELFGLYGSSAQRSDQRKWILNAHTHTGFGDLQI